ncbi:protein YhgP [Escherichia coli str. K-12 substr. MG1655]|uniref:Protein YhgP n=1 Tax=Escherichia coli (strain K12) TaxID=83333 RepID=YHGP_ECOLI|nr:protein YhgP [Escherichia coli str. K-12 substr. MG1655] [Escherichia coli]YP_010051202.1 protein YhgP [Escherichia coli str. K-12 substr. MG1655]P0DSG7.1 RecName: Full=Protein YhgP [Escherichia coli K-12]QNV50542.1 protein YhgP [Escherichia coli str. K-12 substr. MG1655]
MFHDLPGVK